MLFFKLQTQLFTLYLQIIIFIFTNYNNNNNNNNNNNKEKKKKKNIRTSDELKLNSFGVKSGETTNLIMKLQNG